MLRAQCDLVRQQVEALPPRVDLESTTGDAVVAGDIGGDGTDDLVIGAWCADHGGIVKPAYPRRDEAAVALACVAGPEQKAGHASELQDTEGYAAHELAEAVNPASSHRDHSGLRPLGDADDLSGCLTH